MESYQKRKIILEEKGQLIQVNVFNGAIKENK